MKRTAFSPHGDLYVQRIKSTKKNNMPVQHYHDAYEIYLQLSGKRYLFYDNICYTLQRGDMAILKPFDIHYAESREVDNYERYVINFQLEKLSVLLNKAEIHMLSEKISPGVIHLDEEQTQTMYDYFTKTDYFYGQHGFLSEKILYSAVLQLIMQAIKFTDAASLVNGEKVHPQIISAIQYINKHYRENINLEIVSEKLHMSKYYFCRIFHCATGATFGEYLNNVRLTKVHSFLIETDGTLDEIARETGFSSSINLSRAFKKVYNISPRDFRKIKNNE